MVNGNGWVKKWSWFVSKYYPIKNSRTTGDLAKMQARHL
jgi:hypothetical protein